MSQDADQCEGRSDEDIRDAVLTLMKMCMSPEVDFAVCTGCHVTRWEEDEFSMGAYSYFGVGTVEVSDGV